MKSFESILLSLNFVINFKTAISDDRKIMKLTVIMYFIFTNWNKKNHTWIEHYVYEILDFKTIINHLLALKVSYIKMKTLFLLFLLFLLFFWSVFFCVLLLLSSSLGSSSPSSLVSAGTGSENDKPIELNWIESQESHNYKNQKLHVIILEILSN